METKENIRTRFSDQLDIIGNAYVAFLQSHPWIVLLFVGTVSAAMTFCGVYFRLDAISIEPQLGFETRGTTLANEILVLNKVSAIEQKAYGRRRKRFSMANQYTYPCQQYAAIDITDFYAQAIFQADSFDSLFTRDALLELCKVDQLMTTFKEKFGQFFVAHFPWNLPDYALCGNPTNTTKTCSNIEQSEVENLKKLVIRCSNNRNTTECSRMPFSHLLKLLPNNLPQLINDSVHDPIFVTTFLPIYVFSDGSSITLPSLAYIDLLDSFQQLNRELSTVKLKGLNFNFKQTYFQYAILNDIKWGILAVVLVVLMILTFSQSVFFTIMVVASLIMSVGDAYFVYTIVFNLRFFPFTNLLVFVLLVGIGADDTFVLNCFYAAAKKDAQSSTKERQEMAKNAMGAALRHAAIAMFVTSATTAAAFYANLTSNIVVMRCFGVFAGTTMLINYFFVVSWLPASLIILDSTIKPLCGKLLRYFLNQRAAYDKLKEKLSSLCMRMLTNFLPLVIQRYRFVWISAFLAQMVVGFCIIIFFPGLKLPGNNPDQLLRNSHPFEWYDENAVDYFDFAKVYKGGNLFKINILWGWKPVKDASLFNPKNTGSLLRDPNFSIKSYAAFKQFESLLLSIQNSSVVDEKISRSLWLPEFLKWTENKTCAEFLECKIQEHMEEAENATMLNCLQSFALQNSVLSKADRPVFDKDSGEMIGYRMELDSTHEQSLTYTKMKLFFDHLKSDLKPLIANGITPLRGGFFLGDYRITVYFDLLDNLLNGTPISVMISIGVALVVVVASTWHIRISVLAVITIIGTISATIATVVLLGWRINVVEATVIVLTIGLSFDFTLHYAVACKMTPADNNRERQLKCMISAIGMPVLLSALTTFTAGLAMVWSSTQAFYEIGVFMMLVTVYSYVFATFVFTSFISVFSFSFHNQVTRM